MRMQYMSTIHKLTLKLTKNIYEVQLCLDNCLQWPLYMIILSLRQTYSPLSSRNCAFEYLFFMQLEKTNRGPRDRFYPCFSSRFQHYIGPFYDERYKFIRIFVCFCDIFMTSSLFRRFFLMKYAGLNTNLLNRVMSVSEFQLAEQAD